jgi:hypothetical protein
VQSRDAGSNYAAPQKVKRRLLCHHEVDCGGGRKFELVRHVEKDGQIRSVFEGGNLLKIRRFGILTYDGSPASLQFKWEELKDALRNCPAPFFADDPSPVAEARFWNEMKGVDSTECFPVEAVGAV